MENAIKLTGLWKSKDKEGKTFLSGSLSPVSKVLVMPNTFKKEGKGPDYYLYVGVNEKKEGSKPSRTPEDDL